MGVDIYLLAEEGECTVKHMNWLRNPFGLEHWAEMNVQYATRSRGVQSHAHSLWSVINDHSYDASSQVERALFKQTVDDYWAALQDLEQGYFWFDVGNFMSFVVPGLKEMPISAYTAHTEQYRIEGNVFHEQEVGIPQEYFGAPCFHLSDRYNPNRHTLERYKKWFTELVEFAQLPQDPRYEYYCSN